MLDVKVKFLFEFIQGVFFALLAWLVIAPIAFLIPKDKRLIAVIGKDGGAFLDNCKYFYLQSQQHLAGKQKCVFITNKEEVFKTLKKENLPVIVYPSLAGAWFLLRVNIVVVDSFEWFKQLRFFLTLGAKKVQLWHGVGFKQIELGKQNFAHGLFATGSILRRIQIYYRNIIGRNVFYNLVNTTSEFYQKEVFEQAFTAKNFTSFGYPRNAFNYSKNDLINTDNSIFSLLENWLVDHKKIILFVPTFREHRGTPLGLNSENIELINKWCETTNSIIIFKLHPWENGISHVKSPFIYQYINDKDVYPLFPHLNSMISDYSSIYMDFLLLNKPIYFLIPDKKQYLAQDRQIQFDYDEMTPGVKVERWEQLLPIMEKQGESDYFINKRRELCLKAFDSNNQCLSTKMILDFCIKKHWLR